MECSGCRRGRSFDLWDAPVTKFCRWQNIGEWQVAAQDKALWLQYLPDFCFIYAYAIYLLGLTPCALNGLPHHGIQEQSKKNILRFLLNPCCSSGCHCSNGASMHPRNKYAKKLYMRRMFAMGRKSVVTLDCFGFCNIWKNVLRHAHRISPCFRVVFMMLRMVHHTFSGAKCINFATKPHSSETLFAFIRLIVIFTSCKLQSASVS